MCFECDSVWLESQLISDKAGTTFDKHMQSLGRTPNWEDIKKIEMIEKNIPHISADKVLIRNTGIQPTTRSTSSRTKVAMIKV